MSGSSRGRAALAFTAANLGGAALNYLFQVHAAAVLDAGAFGLLSTWLARVTLLGVVATVVQYVSLDFRLADAGWRSIVRTLGVLSAGLLLGHILVGTRMSPVVLGASAVAGGILLYALVGQLQARLQLGIIAASIITAALLRFALPFAWPSLARAPSFYVAHSASSFAAILAIALLARAPAPASTPASAQLRLRRPVLLAFAASLFPLVDILVISSTQSEALTGAFSRIALAARIVFFCGAAALQILLPHELHSATTGDPLPAFAIQLRRFLNPALLAGSLVLAALLDRFVLHTQDDERTWLYATSVSFALLVAILGLVNRFAAHEKLGVAGALVAGVVLSVAVAAAFSLVAGPAGVTRYVLAALAGEALVLAVATGVRMRSSASSHAA